MLNILLCMCWPSVCFLWKNVYSGLLPIFSSLLVTPQDMAFPGQGSDENHSSSLCHSSGNAGSLNPLCWAGDRTCILALQRNSQSCCVTVGTPLLPFLQLGFINIDLYARFIYFGYEPLITHIICKHFLPFNRLS